MKLSNIIPWHQVDCHSLPREMFWLDNSFCRITLKHKVSVIHLQVSPMIGALKILMEILCVHKIIWQDTNSHMFLSRMELVWNGFKISIVKGQLFHGCIGRLDVKCNWMDFSLCKMRLDRKKWVSLRINLRKSEHF